MVHTKSFEQVVHKLRSEYPGVKLLALGQTSFWDEPMKAILCKLLNECYPEGITIIGIHDLDYFSKVPPTAYVSDTWAILPHNDFSTRDLWVATGELSRLFGSEIIPTRDQLTMYGVQLDRIAKDFPDGREALLDMATEAWGWRGLVHTDSGIELARDIRLADALPHFLKLLRWGFEGSLDSLGEPSKGRIVAENLIAKVQAYADNHPEATIADLLLEFLKEFYVLLLRYEPTNLRFTTASELFTFNKSTASLPRFRIVNTFLASETRDICQKAYNQAVEGSDTYTLDKFPLGAIPFDLVIPGRGRGTICLLDNHVVIDLPNPISLPVKTLPQTTAELADLTETHFGSNVMLIGKAVTLVLMIASEFIFVLNEQASAYVPRCKKLATLLKKKGVNLPFFPILRIGYSTWDSLVASSATFRLPGHLAATFHQGEITAQEFAESWRAVVEEQEKLLERISQLSNSTDLLAFLAEQQSEPWLKRIDEYGKAQATIRRLNEQITPLKEESIRLRNLSHQIKAEIQELEIRKGEHFRQYIKPLKDKLWQMEANGINSGSEVDKIRNNLRIYEHERSKIEAEIEQKRKEALEIYNRSLDLKNKVRKLEKREEIQQARNTIKRIEYEAELAKLWLVRDAILVSKGLPYTNHRPTAWWFLLADPELRWFEHVAETTEFRFEEIVSSDFSP
jgi:hypothetical protein